MIAAMSILKIVGAWFCIAGAIAMLFFDKGSNLPLVLGIVSIAFAEAPIG